MNKISFLVLFFFGINLFNLSAQSSDSLANRIFDESLLKGEAYKNLHDLCFNIGGRLAGSPQAAAAVEWGKQLMLHYQFDTVYLQEVTVPHWVRGEKEEAFVHSELLPKAKKMHICALGGSVATEKYGLKGKIIEVKNFDELKNLGKKVKGKIVFFNRPMDATLFSTFKAYGGAVDQRWKGASEAAKLGAIGVIIRSMSLRIDTLPHTGSMHYEDKVNKVPAAAISTKDADELSQLLTADPDLQFYFKMNCHYLPDATSYNVIGELKGSTLPHEIITVGGHLDSWDLAQGAHDDGSGVVQSIEIVRIFKTLGIKPKRTVRVVLFMNEEFGLNGGTAYSKFTKEKNEKLFLALESDAGGFSPRGFSIDTSEDVVKKISEICLPLKDYGIYDFRKGGSGADIYTLKKQGAITMDLMPDSQRYFDYHHNAADTFDKVNYRELQLGAAAMAGLIFLMDKAY